MRQALATFVVFVVSTVVLSVLIEGYKESESDRIERVEDRATITRLQERNDRQQDTIQEWSTAYRVLVAWLQGHQVIVPAWIINPALPRTDHNNGDGGGGVSPKPRPQAKQQAAETPKEQSRSQTGSGDKDATSGNHSSDSPGKSDDKSHGKNAGGQSEKHGKGKGK